MAVKGKLGIDDAKEKFAAATDDLEETC